MRGFRLGLYVVTTNVSERAIGHMDVAGAAVEGGADALQLRDKEMGGGDLLDLAERIRIMVDRAGTGCSFFVNDRLDVAIASGAHGVHLGQEDIAAGAARYLIGEDMVMGISATTVEEAVAAQADGADYLGVGPVFATPTKTDAGDPIGVDGLKRIREAVDLPIVAIGGIDVENAETVFEAGADGIAVISAVTGAEDMLGAVRCLRSLVDACLPGR